jgi:hypothetical protein
MVRSSAHEMLTSEHSASEPGTVLTIGANGAVRTKEETWP